MRRRFAFFIYGREGGIYVYYSGLGVGLFWKEWRYSALVYWIVEIGKSLHGWVSCKIIKEEELWAVDWILFQLQCFIFDSSALIFSISRGLQNTHAWCSGALINRWQKDYLIVWTRLRFSVRSGKKVAAVSKKDIRKLNHQWIFIKSAYEGREAASIGFPLQNNPATN